MFVEAEFIHLALATFALQPLPSTIAANSVEDRFWVLWFPVHPEPTSGFVHHEAPTCIE